MTKMKQVLVMREDLQMSPGKLAAQAAHASIGAYDKAEQESINDWRRTGYTKVVLGVWSEEELIKIYKQAVGAYLPTSLIADEGRTEVAAGTITGCGIGPANVVEINEVTGHLALYGKVQTGKEFL